MTDTAFVAERTSAPALVAHRRTILVAVSLLVSCNALYMLLSPAPSSQWGDSLYYGYLAEEGITTGWPGSHPLGHVFFSMIFVIARWAGYTGRGLPLFQAVANLLGGVTVALFFLSGVAVFRTRLLVSAALALALGVSTSAWRLLGNTADIYSLAFPTALAAWSALAFEIQRRSRPYLVLPGVLIGLAILLHQFNVLLLVPGLVLVLLEGKARQWRVVSLLATVGLTVALGYLLIWFFFVAPNYPGSMWRWVRGPVGQAAWGGYFNWEGIPVAVKGATDALVSAGSFSLKFSVVRSLLLIPFVFTAIAGFARLRRADVWRRRLIVAAFLQWALNFLLILWFEPFNPKYWALALLPFFVMLAGMTGTLEPVWAQFCRVAPQRLRGLAPVVLFLPVVALMVFNVYAVAIPGHRQDETGELWAAHSGPDDLLFPPWMYANYLKYWENRLNTVELDPTYLIPGYGSEAALAALEKRIDETLCNQHLVLYTPYSFELYSDRQFERVGSSRQAFAALFDRYTLTERFSYQTGKITVKVYSLNPAMECDR